MIIEEFCVFGGVLTIFGRPKALVFFVLTEKLCRFVKSSHFSSTISLIAVFIGGRT
jgi:hypothetical protein